MKRIFLFVWCMVSLQVNAQTGEAKTNGANEIVQQELQRVQDSVARAFRQNDSVDRLQTISQNMNGILQLQKERRAKEKKAAITRIAIGLGFLALLVVGLMRRKKK